MIDFKQIEFKMSLMAANERELIYKKALKLASELSDRCPQAIGADKETVLRFYCSEDPDCEDCEKCVYENCLRVAYLKLTNEGENND